MVSLEKMNKEIVQIKEELAEIKARLGEEFELSESAKKELKKAREEDEYVSHDEIMRKYG